MVVSSILLCNSCHAPLPADRTFCMYCMAAYHGTCFGLETEPPQYWEWEALRSLKRCVTTSCSRQDFLAFRYANGTERPRLSKIYGVCRGDPLENRAIERSCFTHPTYPGLPRSLTIGFHETTTRLVGSVRRQGVWYRTVTIVYDESGNVDRFCIEPHSQEDLESFSRMYPCHGPGHSREISKPASAFELLGRWMMGG